MPAHGERDLNFDVAFDWVLPDTAGFTPIGGTVEVESARLRDTYHDTAEHDLLVHAVTLRRCSSDGDPGWQLQIPDGRGHTQLRAPARGGGVPKALQDVIRGVRRGEALGVVAELRTERTVHRILDPAGAALVELRDDRITATEPGEVAVVREWRELTIEGIEANQRLLKQLSRTLRKSGAVTMSGAVALARALEDGRTLRREDPVDGSLNSLVHRYVSEQYVALIAGDLDLRRDRNVVHPTRVATRRLRSVLRVFGALFEPQLAARLDVELAWYAGLLGDVRDRQVLKAHLDKTVHDLPGELVLGPVAARIDQRLSGEEHEALGRLRQAMTQARYLALLGELRAWREHPPFIDDDRNADQVAAFVRKAERTMDKRLRRAHLAADPQEALHAARKAGKRARYIAELAEPVLGKHARQVIKRATRLQDELGGLQDSVVASEFLRQAGAQAGTVPGENGFTYGLLWALEHQHGRDVEHAAVRGRG